MRGNSLSQVGRKRGCSDCPWACVGGMNVSLKCACVPSQRQHALTVSSSRLFTNTHTHPAQRLSAVTGKHVKPGQHA